MPKKKKGSGKKKKGGKKAAAAVDPLSPEYQIKRKEQEIALLKNELAHRTEIARRSTFHAEQLRSELCSQQDNVEDEQQATLDITSDLARQYKLMQSQLMNKILELQQNTNVLQAELDVTRKALDETKAEAQKQIQEKNDKIAELSQRIQSMESAYENVLNDALDAMAGKVEAARERWEVESYVVQQRNKERLMEFGLSHVNF